MTRKFVLDTNILWSDVLLRGAKLEALLDARQDEKFDVVVPQVVVGDRGEPA